MQWHKCTLSAEQIVSGEGFEKLFMTLSAPKDMALFSEKHFSKEGSVFYFSPGSYQYAKALILKHLGEPCDKPDSNSVALLVAHDGMTPDSV